MDANIQLEHKFNGSGETTAGRLTDQHCLTVDRPVPRKSIKCSSQPASSRSATELSLFVSICNACMHAPSAWGHPLQYYWMTHAFFFFALLCTNLRNTFDVDERNIQPPRRRSSSSNMELCNYIIGFVSIPQSQTVKLAALILCKLMLHLL